MSELIDRDELCRWIALKPATVATYIHRRLIPHVRLGRRLVRFERAAIEAWLEERRVAAEGGR